MKKEQLVYWIAQCDSTDVDMQVSKPQVDKKCFTGKAEQMGRVREVGWGEASKRGRSEGYDGLC